MVGVGAAASAVGARGHTGGLLDSLQAVRARAGLVLLLFALAGLAWWSTVRSMAGMDAGPGTDLGTLGWFVGVWVVMMAAMMFPSVAPTVALYARMTSRRGPVRPLLFTAAYLLVWGCAGVVAYALFDAGRSWFGGALAWDSGGRWLAGGIIGVAAIYELTPWKDACLGRCRSPLAFLLGSWRDGPIGSLSMGARHALWCVGCCWALMAALFALGVMSLTWMAVVAGAIAAEKTLPWRRVVVWGTTAVLLAFAVTVIVAPHSLPGFVVPDNGGGNMTMGTMG